LVVVQIPEQYFRAGKIVSAIRPWVKSQVSPGTKYRDIAVGVEEEIVRRGGQPAFPCGIGVNEVTAHYAPVNSDPSVIDEGDVVKVDYGVHIDGYIADTAVTVTFNPRYQSLLEATERALRAAIDTVMKDRRTGELGRAIQREAERERFKTINNLSGHTLEQYIVHAGKSIPNLFVANLPALKKGDVFAIEPFLTPGDAAGYVVEAPQETIFSVISRKRTGRKDADELLDRIWKMRRTLPFTPRWLGKDDAEIRQVAELLETLRGKKLIRGYGTLVEASSRPVAQFEHTLAVGDDDTVTVLTT
jgi:methionyl aminopeptidase